MSEGSWVDVDTMAGAPSTTLTTPVYLLDVKDVGKGDSACGLASRTPARKSRRSICRFCENQLLPSEVRGGDSGLIKKPQSLMMSVVVSSHSSKPTYRSFVGPEPGLGG